MRSKHTVEQALPKGTVTLREDLREALRRVALARGTDAASALLSVAPATLARAIAGLPVTRAVETHLGVRLANLDAQAAGH